MDDADARQLNDDVLRMASVTVSIVLAGYAATAGVPFRVDLAVLGGALARLYDDLIDQSGSTELDQQLAMLFNAGQFTPTHDGERLFFRLYQEVERRLGVSQHDPIRAELRALHEYQVRSRRQVELALSAAELADITRGKGGYAATVMFALINPGMTVAELALIRDIGEVLQLIDDYQDVALDRQAGITTAATLGQLSLSELCRKLRHIRPTLRAHYGRERPFCGVIYLRLWACFLHRHWPRRPGAWTALDVLVSRARRNLGYRRSANRS